MKVIVCTCPPLLFRIILRNQIAHVSFFAGSFDLSVTNADEGGGPFGFEFGPRPPMPPDSNPDAPMIVEALPFSLMTALSVGDHVDVFSYTASKVGGKAGLIVCASFDIILWKYFFFFVKHSVYFPLHFSVSPEHFSCSRNLWQLQRVQWRRYGSGSL